MCTWKKYVIMHHVSEHVLRIKDRRAIFAIMRSDDLSHDHLLPSVGMTLGEFAFFHLICESRRKTTQSHSHGHHPSSTG